MKKHLVNFSFVALSAILFFGGWIFYQKYLNASEKEAVKNEIVANSGGIEPQQPVEIKQKESESSLQEEVTGEVENKAASCPAELINLINWKQTLPVGNNKKPTEILQPALATYSNNSCFQLNAARDGIVFRAPVTGVTTSGSGYPRSELREMADGGKKQASWSTSTGTHIMYIDEAITSVPKTKKHVVAGQIHDSSDDVIVIRLEYPKLFIDINGKDGPVLDAKYTLGKRFNVKFVAENGKIKVYYNGEEKYTLNKKISGAYFKAGAYTQSNCSKEKDCSDGNYGEVVIYDLKVDHKS